MQRFSPVSAGGRSLRATDGTIATRDLSYGIEGRSVFRLGWRRRSAGPVTAFAARGLPGVAPPTGAQSPFSGRGGPLSSVWVENSSELMLIGVKTHRRLTRRAGADAPLSGAGVHRRGLRRHPASDVGFPPPPLRPIIRRAVFVLALGGRFVAHRNLAVLGLGLKAAPCRLGDRRSASGVQGCQSSPRIIASAQRLQQFPDRGLPARLRRLSSTTAERRCRRDWFKPVFRWFRPEREPQAGARWSCIAAPRPLGASDVASGDSSGI